MPYRGTAPALTDLIGGQVQMVFCTIPSAIQYINAGKLRALAVTGATRSKAMPDVPTVGETVPGLRIEPSGTALGAPRGTPAEIIATLNKEINGGARRSEVEGAGSTSSAA